MFADYQPEQNKGFRVEFSELDATLIQELVDEVYAAVPDAPDA